MSKGAAGWGVSITRGPFLHGAELAQTLRLTLPAAMADTLPDEHEQLLTILCCLSAKSWGESSSRISCAQSRFPLAW